MELPMRSSMLAAAVAGLLLAPPGGAGEESQPTLMRVGYSGRMSVEVGREDVQVAVELWARQVTVKMGRQVSSRISFFDDRTSLRAAIESESLDVVVLPVLDFLDLRDQVDIEPCLVSQSGGRWGYEFVLVVHRAKGIERLQQLEASKLVLHTRSGANSLERMWLETLLGREGGWRANEFFADVREVAKTSPAVLAVLFGQADVALVMRQAFETMAELNPQLITDLDVIATSPGYIPTVTCFLPNTEQAKKEAIYQGALELHTHPKGQQILTLFANDQVIPFAESYLQGVLDLRSEHQRLGAAARKGGSS